MKRLDLCCAFALIFVVCGCQVTICNSSQLNVQITVETIDGGAPFNLKSNECVKVTQPYDQYIISAIGPNSMGKKKCVSVYAQGEPTATWNGTGWDSNPGAIPGACPE